MTQLIHRENIAKIATLLSGKLDRGKRATLMRLLVDEEGRLGTGLEQFALAETRIANANSLIRRQRELIDRLRRNGKCADGAIEQLAAFTELEALFELYRQQIIKVLDRRLL